MTPGLKDAFEMPMPKVKMAKGSAGPKKTLNKKKKKMVAMNFMKAKKMKGMG